MNAKRLFKIAAALAICASLGACATQHQQGQYQSSKCPDGNNYGAAALGALAGGVLGSTIGMGTGNSVAIAAGAATGAMVANNMACR